LSELKTVVETKGGEAQPPMRARPKPALPGAPAHWGGMGGFGGMGGMGMGGMGMGGMGMGGFGGMGKFPGQPAQQKQ
jgi:hypothetical protein